MPRVNVTDGSGRTISVDEAELEALRRLNYREETATAESARLTEESRSEFYGSGGQGAITALEGVASGATLGLSDLLLDDEDTRARAQHNPGLRLGGELTGAIVPALLTGGTGALAKAAAITPAGLAARAGAAGARAAGRGTVTALGIEGAIQGAGGAVTRATLANDPVTVESVVAGAGMGALLGAGLGVMSRGVVKAGEHAQARVVARQADAAEAILARESPALKRAFRDGAEELAEGAKRAVKETTEALSPAGIRKLTRGLRAYDDQVLLESGKAAFRAASGELPAFRKALDDLSRARSSVAAKGSQEAVAAYRDAIQAAADAAGVRVQVPAHAMRSAQQVADLAESAGVLKRLPTTPRELAAMSDERAADLFPGVARALRDAGDELDPVRLGIREDLVGALDEAGLKAAGTSPEAVMEGLDQYRRALRDAHKTVSAGKPLRAQDRTFLGFVRHVGSLAAARKASSAARGAGMGALGSALAYHGAGLGIGSLFAEISGLRAAAVSHIDEIVAKIAPKGAAAVRRIAPVGERLRVGLTGERDDDPRKDHRQLAADRIREIAQIAPVASDAAYSAVEPLAAADPELALAVSQQMMRGFQHLLRMAPRDPGATNIGLRSDWVPSDSQALEMAGMYEAITAPMDAFERVCTGDGDQATADALWEVHPGLMQEGAVRLMERLPEIQDETDLSTRSALSMAFRVPLDGLLFPQSVAALQSLYVPPAPEKGRAQTPRPPGRPAATETTRTQSLMGAPG